MERMTRYNDSKLLLDKREGGGADQTQSILFVVGDLECGLACQWLSVIHGHYGLTGNLISSAHIHQ